MRSFERLTALTALAPYGYDEAWAASFASEAPLGAEPARVVRHDGIAVMVVTAGGTRQVHVRRSSALTTGDWVSVSDNLVTSMLPRRTLLRRRDPRADIEQVLAANIDIVMVVCGLDRDFNSGRLQRSLALATDSGARPVVLLTKADVIDNEAEVVDELHQEYTGVTVLSVSSTDGQGLDEVRAMVKGNSVVLLGESGSGKSTLTNALLGSEIIETGEVRSRDAGGRHTTSTRQLHLVPSGGVLIDNPGLRSLGLWGAEEDALDDTFEDVEAAAETCRFGNCGHTSEPGCGVRAQAAQGELELERVEAWMALQADISAAAERAEQHRWRQSDRKSKRR